MVYRDRNKRVWTQFQMAMTTRGEEKTQLLSKIFSTMVSSYFRNMAEVLLFTTQEIPLHGEITLFVCHVIHMQTGLYHSSIY